ncbi:hypothetical protein N8T08_001373 [Aspergillus melleus]|uniref:Uncharacterized protein n=1 Tax=Aspergillus melleus TaxID=138277 RepID=A0ACC3BA78_9EURO|nr:hypothetical protein N8T08_001373 [Aspergillus melleus]
MVTPYIFRTVHVQFLRYKHLALGVFANRGYNKTINLPLNGMNKQETEQLREATRKLNPLLERNVGTRIFPHVNVLTVSYGPSYNEDVHSESIGGLVANLPNLQTIRWRGIPFPPHLFKNLRCRQTPPELYFEGAPEEIVGNDLLVGAPFIRSLSITYLPIARSPNHAELNDKLGAVILSLPNLERLILKQYGIHTEQFSYLRPPFHLPGDSALPNL